MTVLAASQDIPHWCAQEGGDPAKCVPCQIKAHASEIAELRELVSEHISDEEHDDLYLLRYILSNKSAKNAVEPIKRAVKWRNDNQQIVDLVRKGEEHPLHFEVNRFVATELHKAKKDGGPIYIIRSGISNPPVVMDLVPYEQMLDWFMFEKEKAWVMCDRATRESGRIVKMLMINDANNLSFMRARDKRFMRLLSESSQIAEDLYPQFVDLHVFMNLPRVMYTLLAVAKKIMPKRTFEKVRICPGDTLKGDINKCPYVKSMINLGELPTFLGGACDCPGGCVQGVPNHIRKPLGVEIGDE